MEAIFVVVVIIITIFVVVVVMCVCNNLQTFVLSSHCGAFRVTC